MIGHNDILEIDVYCILVLSVEVLSHPGHIKEKVKLSQEIFSIQN